MTGCGEPRWQERKGAPDQRAIGTAALSALPGPGTGCCAGWLVAVAGPASGSAGEGPAIHDFFFMKFVDARHFGLA